MISERDCPVGRAVNKVCAPHFQQDYTVPSDNVPLVCHRWCQVNKKRCGYIWVREQKRGNCTVLAEIRVSETEGKSEGTRGWALDECYESLYV